MTDWTTILTTIGASAVTGVVAWYGTRTSAEVANRQTHAEIERLREQHAEDHRRNRQTTYHRFLATDAHLRMFTNRLDKLDGDEVNEFGAVLVAWRDHISGVRLFGTETVATAVDAYEDLMIEVGHAWSERRGRRSEALRSVD